jgi:hypothetical protein
VASNRRAPREVNWWLGLALGAMVLGFAMTGFPLAWDQRGYWVSHVETGIMGTLPVVGPLVQRLVLGGTQYGALTLTRFFTLHVMPVMSAEGPNTVRGERQVDYHGHDESVISKALVELTRKHPLVSIRTRVQGVEGARTIRLNLVAEQEDPVQLADLLDKAEQDLRDRLGIELRSRPTDASMLGD